MPGYYMSMTMGNLVATKREVIRQVFESLFRLHTLDIKWEFHEFEDAEDEASFRRICHGL